MKELATIAWDEGSSCIRFIDQTQLPETFSIVECRTVDRLATAIRRLEIRGAPALGVAGAFGVALAAVTCTKKDLVEFQSEICRSSELLASTRPTAINLSWGIRRVLGAMQGTVSVEGGREAAITEALSIAREDEACCRAIGDSGAALLPSTCTVLTHCNAGSLACTAWGTALGVIRSAISQGKDVRVIACETRPLLQGSRLTAWELARDRIDVTVVTDSMAAHLMREGAIDTVMVGADRITRDAVFNKIGTYMHAVCARHHGIPFYVAAPLSTFDTEHDGQDIIIEERAREEVATCGARTIVPENVKVRNPAFDSTPMDLIAAIITEQGILRPPVDMKGLTPHRTTM